MNTAVRIIPHQRTLAQENTVTREENLVLLFPELRILLLLIIFLISAISLVYIKDLNRRLFVDLQNGFADYQNLQVVESKLLLEQSAWSKQARVQQLAEGQFDMQIPSISNIMVLKLKSKTPV